MVASAACLLCGPAAAGSFYSQESSVRGAGRAFSGEVAETGADALWWNPAAIARSEREFYLGGHYRRFSGEVTDDGSTVTRPIPPAGLTTPVGGQGRISDFKEDQLVPNGAITVRLYDRVGLGLSVTQPFILENDFGPDGWTRYDTIDNLIEATNIQATAAVQLAPWLDAGVGVNAQYIDAALSAAYPNLSPLQSDAVSVLEVDGWNYGFVLGAQAHSERITVGASYRSAIKNELRGRISLSDLQAPLSGANFQSASDTTFSTPWIGMLGVRWRVSPTTTLNAQIQRFGWSEYDAVVVEFDGGGESIAQDFKDTTTFAAGIDHQVSPRLTVRGGVQHDPTPTRDYLREPGVVDGNRWLYSAGATLQLRPRISVDAAISRAEFEDTRVAEDAVFYRGTPARTDVRMRGDFSGDVTTASVGLRFKY